ncbi:MAG: Cys-tRNA(Pro) deacylase [Clostridiales bacterium]|nr:Cys-tRNA(Pro) deacylase [Clostridiales bacterium]
MRILDQAKVTYKTLEYDLSDGHIDGVSVANKINIPVEQVFKTLVLVGHSKTYYVVMIPVDKNVHLKSVAKHFGEKKIEMIPVKDITKLTGYIRGGCSPLGMKKSYKTVLDESAILLDEFVFSAGKQGLQIQMTPDDFIRISNCDVKNVVE